MLENTLTIQVTSQAKAYLQNIGERLGNMAMNEAAGSMLRTIDGFKMFLEVFNGKERIKEARNLVDMTVKRELKDKVNRKITCKRGCSECCRMYVCTVESEAEDLYDYIKENSIAVAWDRAKKQRGLGEDGYYTNKLGEVNKCMFLSDEGTCKVYPLRPLACRLQFVVSPKSSCSMVNPENVLKVFLPDSEAIIMAVLNLESDSRGSLADHMLSVKEKTDS